MLSLWRAAAGPAGATDTREGLAQLLRCDPEGLLIADSEEAPIGSLIAVCDGWRGNLYRLAVLPERRREGVATALLREGERHLRTLGAVRLAAVVAEGDDHAMAFWQAAGYRMQGDRTRFVRELEA